MRLAGTVAPRPHQSVASSLRRAASASRLTVGFTGGTAAAGAGAVPAAGAAAVAWRRRSKATRRYRDRRQCLRGRSRRQLGGLALAQQDRYLVRIQQAGQSEVILFLG